jgi:putative ABC transport system permease protein
MVYVVGIIGGLLLAAVLAFLPFFVLLLGGELVLDWVPFLRGSRFVRMILKNLRRNLVRTSLTYLATFVLVFVVTMVWSVLYYLDNFLTAKTKSPKVIVSEKWQIRSQMPFPYSYTLSEGAANPQRPDDVRPLDTMTWQFYSGTTEPAKPAPANILVCIAMEPRKILTMMEDIWDDISTDQGKHRGQLKPEQEKLVEDYLQRMEATKNGLIVGTGRLRALEKEVGNHLTLSGIDFKGIDLEFEIVGKFPEGRYSEIAVMNRDYLNDAINSYPKTQGGAKHPLADKSLNLVWLLVSDQQAFNRLAEQIESSGLYQAPPVKCQTLSAEIVSALDAYEDLIWGMRWLLSPAILITMTLVLSNAIGISVRERRTELAVLKVLGFGPGQILTLVLGEALLIGAVSGLFSTFLSYATINHGLNQYVENLIYVPDNAIWWGPGMGALAALGGSVFPAMAACRVKVTDVFARVA